MDEKNIFSQMDFGPLAEFLEQDDVTDISYSNGGQVWLKTLSKGVYQVERPDINNAFMEKLAFQCSNVMGRTFNMAHPFLDAESAELRMNFVHDSIATNGIACLIRKTPAKIRLNKEKLLSEQYITDQMHDFLIKCVLAHCNIMIAGETGSGKTELVKYLASNTKEDEKIISIEDTLELHLDKIFPHRDIVAMKTNNIASYSDSLVACMRQNPIWILLAEVRSAEAVMAVRNSISSGHHIISTIHADKASSIPMRMYALLEGSQDIEQYLSSVHRYIQIGIYIKGYYSKVLDRFQREILEICEFYVDDETNKPMTNILYSKTLDGKVTLRNPTKKLIDYLAIGNVYFDTDDIFGLGDAETKEDDSILRKGGEADNLANIKHDSSKMDEMLNADGKSTGNATPAAAAANAVKPEPQIQPANNTQQQVVPKQITPVAQTTATPSQVQPIQSTNVVQSAQPVVQQQATIAPVANATAATAVTPAIPVNTSQQVVATSQLQPVTTTESSAEQVINTVEPDVLETEIL